MFLENKKALDNSDILNKYIILITTVCIYVVIKTHDTALFNR